MDYIREYKKTIYAISGITLLVVSIIIAVKLIKPSLKKSYGSNNEFKKKSSQPNNVVELMFFYTAWCPYCKKARPEWDKFKNQWENKSIQGYSIVFTEVDCDTNEKLANEYKVDGYPTIKLLKDNKVVDYDAKPSVDTLNSFLKNEF
jgi:thiol-disulfide isomerase/thioredoxin